MQPGNSRTQGGLGTVNVSSEVAMPVPPTATDKKADELARTTGFEATVPTAPLLHQNTSENELET